MAVLGMLASPGVAAGLVIALVSIIYFVANLVRVRVSIRDLIRQGKPVIPHSFVFGNLLEAKKAIDAIPPGAHSLYVLAKMISLTGKSACYLDTWPIVDPMLLVTDPIMANEVAYHQTSGPRKPKMLEGWFHPITGGLSLFDSNDQHWKYLHNLFTPSFSNNNITAEVPIMVENIEVFTRILRQKAKGGEMFRMEPLALDLIIDIIGEILLNARLGTQERSHPLAETMKYQLKLKFTGHKPENVLSMIDPVLQFKTWNNGRKLDNLITTRINARFQLLKEDQAHNRDKVERFRSVLDLALEDYMQQPGNNSRTSLDQEFLTVMTRNMRMFFFAGYDSTASTIVYCFHNIYSRPEVLARVREEVDAVFGADIAATPARILENPALLNQVPYMQACIKESSRLFPAANGIREGSPELVLKDEDGTTYPTAGLGVQMLHWAIQRNPKYWRRPDEFIPERWLVEPGHELYPPKGGWRVFEYGPRVCIGQQMVMTEVKAVLACVVREFDIRDCYAELDGGKKYDLSGVGGQRVFMVEAGAAHPVDAFPCRVSMSGYVPKAGK